MNLPKFIFSLVLLFCFVGKQGFSQKDSSKKWLRISVNVAAIINNSFSNQLRDIPEASSILDPSRNETPEISDSKKSPRYLPGYNLGLTSTWGKSRIHHFTFGLSVSFTRSEHMYSAVHRNPGPYYPNTGTIHETTTIRMEVHSSHFYLNPEVGYKFRIYKGFFLQPSFLINHLLKRVQIQEGTKTKTGESANPATPWYNYEWTDAIHETRTFYHEKSQASARITAFYEFRKNELGWFSIFAFRNFGIAYKLPWWGLGGSVYF